MKKATVISTNIKNSFRVIKSIWSLQTQLHNQVTPFGYDSVPIKSQIGISIRIGGTRLLFGYIQKAFDGLESGESAMFSKDDSGSIKSYAIQRKTGQMELQGTGDYLVRFNELKTEFNELQQKYNALVGLYNSFMTHTHTYLPGPLPAVQSGAPSIVAQAQTSTADINNAKHERIETISKPII